MRSVARGLALCAMVACLCGVTAIAPLAAQDSVGVRSPILVVEFDRLFRDSAFGQRVAADLAAQNDALAAQNRRIEAELEAEELALTEQRPTLAPEEFRTLADAFDQRVRSVRREQEQKARIIARSQEARRGEFLSAAAPVLEAMMQDAGAVVILDRRSVFLSLNAIDITSDALSRIDEVIGDGSE